MIGVLEQPSLFRGCRLHLNLCIMMCRRAGRQAGRCMIDLVPAIIAILVTVHAGIML